MKNWFWDDTENEIATDSSEDETEYTTVQRKNKNKIKLKKAKDKKRSKREEIAQKASHMIGLGPIDKKELLEELKNTKDFEKVKVEAVKNYLKRFFKYNKEELDRLTIVSTKYSDKGEGILYVAFADQGDIKDVYSRKAECRRNDVTVRMYIPPQFYERFAALNNICKEKRMDDDDLKTQVRFGHDDLEILVKTKGTEEPFKNVNLKEFIGDMTLPEFDYSIKWKKQIDRSPRRHVSSSRSSSPANLPAKGKTNFDRPRMRKQMSVESKEDTDAKRTKNDASTEESSSSDDEGQSPAKRQQENAHDETI